jgi:hypothetical protein
MKTMDHQTYKRFLCLLEKLSKGTNDLCNLEERSPDELLQSVRESDRLLQELSTFDLRAMEAEPSQRADGSDSVSRLAHLKQSLQDLIIRTQTAKQILETAAAKSATDLKSLREMQKASRAYRALA